MERLVGVDATRGLAVLGMVTAHVAPAGLVLAPVTDLADGRSAATFALLAGLSASLLARRDTGARASVRVLVRAVLLWPLGALLIALGTPVAVILPSYAAMLAFVSVVLRVPSAVLLGLATGFAVLGPPLVLAVRTPGLPQLVDVLVGEHYPALVWTAYLLVGVVVGRADLASRRTLAWLAGAGVLAVVVGEVVLGRGGRALLERAGAAGFDGPSWVAALADTTAHADTTPEVVRNVGATLLVLAAALALARAGRAGGALMTPLVATGALALTAYVGHIVVLAISQALGRDLVREPATASWLGLVLGVVAVCWAWWVLLGRGPLERALHLVSSRAADVVAGPRSEREDARV